MYCSHCAAEVLENSSFCVACGSPVRIGMSAPVAQPGLALPSATGQIAFSVINIVTGVGVLFGAIALVFSILGSEAKSCADAVSKLKTAKILNIVGVSLTGFFILCYVAFFLVMFGLMGFGFLAASGS